MKKMNNITVRIEVEVHPTENVEKVKQAVENLFGKVEYETKPYNYGCLLIAKTRGTEGLTKLYNLLRRERIRDAARSVLFKAKTENTITFYLNKQVAYAGHVSFCQAAGESPLGPIKIEITCENPTELINWLAPKTG
ncbi:hypothetical protein DRO34_06070 [Candidatus Bathyarchaeota archaeon]|nr:MAG: hypothetical protein DRO34_06070 [Candidatus Bathyarchaeota archaeon]